jgi:molecular chaperone GrpE
MQGESRGTNPPPGADDESAVESGEVKGVAPAGSDPLAQALAEAARHKEAWLRAGKEDVVRALLPVFDNLERALQSAQRSSDVKAMADGLSMVQRQFTDALGREGIVRVPTVGHPFDPSVHEAIQQVETGEHEPGTIIAEVQPGYRQGDRLLRAAMVVVARSKGAPEEAGPISARSN